MINLISVPDQISLFVTNINKYTKYNNIKNVTRKNSQTKQFIDPVPGLLAFPLLSPPFLPHVLNGVYLYKIYLLTLAVKNYIASSHMYMQFFLNNLICFWPARGWRSPARPSSPELYPKHRQKTREERNQATVLICECKTIVFKAEHIKNYTPLSSQVMWCLRVTKSVLSALGV